MKKTLIAVAALVATGAFAQSTVTISGTMDAGMSIASVQATITGATSTGGTTAKTTAFIGNGSSTSAINIAGSEDLGGGMKANFFVETNPDMSGAVGSAAGAAAGGFAAGTAGTAFGGGQRFVGLSGSFGSIKIGSPNSAALEVIGMSNPFGTALGGGYSSSFSRIGAAGTSVTAAPGAATNVGPQLRIIRAERSMRYDSPDMSGFKLSYNLAFANTGTTGAATQTGYQAIGLTYSAGPLNVGYTTSTAKNTGTAVGAVGLNTLFSGNGAVALNAGENWTVNVLSANYTMGAATVYAGYTSNKLSPTVGANDGSSMNVALKYQMSGALSVAGNFVKRKDNLALGANGQLFGLGLDYALSKRTATYARYEKFDNNTATADAGDSKVYAFGVRHTF